jgi:hypothetical protein
MKVPGKKTDEKNDSVLQTGLLYQKQVTFNCQNQTISNSEKN